MSLELLRRRGAVWFLVVLAVSVTSVVVFPRPGEAAPAMPGFKHCGSFKVGPDMTIHVQAQHVSCRLAMKVQREYWLSPEDEKELVGPDEYNGYVRLKRFPGWRCTSGAGAGNCAKGRRDAFYSTFPE